MQILVTGFVPFGGSPVNPSEQAARALDGQELDGVSVCAVVLPVDWQRGPARLLAALDELHPGAVICLGEAAGRTAISIERLAVNLLDFRIPDNSGVTITDQPVIPGGPAAYFATLPVRDMLSAVQQSGVPAELSLSAGSYLCNQVLYHLLHATAGQPLLAGFIHLPCLPEESAVLGNRQPSMARDTQLTGLRAAVQVVARQLTLASP